MRTTLTLDPDVAKLLEQEVHRIRKPRKHVVNEALRRGLMSPHGGARAKPHRVRPHVTRLLPGPDVGHLNALADELEDAVVIARAGTQKRS